LSQQTNIRAGEVGGPEGRPELPKQYRPTDHETRIRARWEASGAFHADPGRVLRGEAKAYSIVIPPPNVTAQLHLGHALNNTLQDVLVRAHRMMGFEALWMPGTDHAGIATQTVVEKRVLQQEGKRRTDFPRAEFVAKIQAFKDEYEAVITGQLKAMGCSCDWDRQRFTMDEVCARAVNEAFFRLFRDGLIYRGKRLVNWDPVTQTALSDDEVEMEEVDGKFYYLRYPLVDPLVRGSDPGSGQSVEASEGETDEGNAFVPCTWSEMRQRGYPVPEDADHQDEEQAYVTVATTRPETYLGDTAVAINPKDPRAKALRGLLVELPLVGRVIPIVEDDYVVMPAADPDAEGVDPKAKFATGFLKVTPAHDPNDYELGRRHGLAAINVMAPDASISDKHGWQDIGDAHIFVGKSREAARELVVKEFYARNLVEAIKPYRHSVGHSYRSHAAIEPYLSDQWYVKVTDLRLRDSALRAMADDQRSGSGSQPTGEGGAGFQPPGKGGAGFQPASSPTTAPWRPSGPSLSKGERRLPHWQQGGRTYFVTFRLSDGSLSESERQLVLDACTFWHDSRATIHLVTVMPDHVHILLTPLQQAPEEWWSLGQIMQSIKGYSAREIGKIRGTAGGFWQDEYFDRIVRDADEFQEKWNYMLKNPVTAGLAEQPGDYAFVARSDFGHMVQQGSEEFRRALAGELFADGRGGTGAENQVGLGSGGGLKARPTDKESPEGDGGLRFYPDRYARTFETWHENIRDWCISRQLWWGHQIPVWSRDFGTEAEARACLANWQARAAENPDRLASSWSPQPDSFRVLLGIRDPKDHFASDAERDGFARDPDVLDTWFSSALWPMSTMLWPEGSELLKAFNPSNVLCTAREIITLWVSRMVMFNRYFMPEGWPKADTAETGRGNGTLPFKDVFIHAMIQDGEGRKMSKSLGNGVDPLDIISSHGADAMRFVLVQMTTQTQDVRMPVERDAASGKNTSPKFDLGRNLCNKLWQVSTGFALAKLGTKDGPEGARPQDKLLLIDRWMLSRLAAAVEQINASIAGYQFSDYAQSLYDLLWRDFCDWYVEGIKPTVASDPMQRAVLAHTIESIVRLLHPITPFITEAIWERMKDVETLSIPGIELGPSRKDGLLATAGWPKIAPHFRDAAAEAQFERLRGLITAIREVRSQHGVPPRRKVTLHCSAELDAEARRGGLLVETLAMVDRITSEAPAGPAAAFAFGSVTCHLSNMADEVDVEAEQTRLEKAIAELEKSIKTLEGRLNNPGYAQKAPPAMVKQSQEQLAKAIGDRDAAATALRSLR